MVATDVFPRGRYESFGSGFENAFLTAIAQAPGRSSTEPLTSPAVLELVETGPRIGRLSACGRQTSLSAFFRICLRLARHLPNFVLDLGGLSRRARGLAHGRDECSLSEALSVFNRVLRRRFPSRLAALRLVARFDGDLLEALEVDRGGQPVLWHSHVVDRVRDLMPGGTFLRGVIDGVSASLYLALPETSDDHELVPALYVRNTVSGRRTIVGSALCLRSDPEAVVMVESHAGTSRLDDRLAGAIASSCRSVGPSSARLTLASTRPLPPPDSSARARLVREVVRRGTPYRQVSKALASPPDGSTTVRDLVVTLSRWAARLPHRQEQAARYAAFWYLANFEDV